MIDKRDEIRTRIEARRAELQARLKKAKADAQGASGQVVESIEKKLTALQEALRNGWEKLSDAALDKLNRLLRDE